MGRSRLIKKIIWNAFFWVELVAALYIGYAVYFVDVTSTKSKWIGLFAGSVAILFAVLKFVENAYIRTKSDAIKEKIHSYLSFVRIFYAKVSKIVTFLVLFSSIVCYFTLGGKFAFLVIVGAYSALILNMTISKMSLVSAIEETLDFKNEISFKKVFNSAIVASFLPYGVLVSLYVIFFHAFKDYQILFGYALGIVLTYFCLMSINAISLKTSSYTNEMFALAENRNIEEKKIATYLFDGFKAFTPAFSHSSSILMFFVAIFVASVSTGAFCMAIMGQFLPIVIIANGLFSAILVLAFVRLTKKTNYIKTFVLTNIFSAVIFNVINYFTIKTWLPTYLGLTWALVTGSVCGLFVLFYYIRKIFYSERSLVDISNSAAIGLKNEFIQIVKKSLNSAFLPYFLMMVVILVSFFASYGLEAPLMGVWGVVLCAFGFLCSSIVSLLYANFCQNLVNMDLFSKKIGNGVDFDLIKETGKKFLYILNKYVNFAFLLVSFASILNYGVVIELEEVDLMNPYVSSALMLGFGMVFVFLSLLINNVFRSSKRLAFDIKKSLKFSSQNKENLLMLNRFSLNNLLNDVQIGFWGYFLLIVVVFSLVGVFLKAEAIVGFLLGATISFVGINTIGDNISTIVYLLKRFFARLINNENDVLPQENTQVIKECFSFFEDFVSPSLISAVTLAIIVALAFIPVWAKFM